MASTKTSSERDLNEGPVSRALLAVSAPMTLGILGVLSVGLADAFFLARAGETALAAIGYIFPVIAALTSLSIGLAAGTNTVVSQAIGKGSDDAARQRLTLHAMLLAAVLATLVSVLFYFAAPSIFWLMGARGAVLDEIGRYVVFWCFSFPPMVVGMALNAVFRAAGRSGIAATVMTSQAVINIALDPLFIFGLGPVESIGTAGAGVATLLARTIAFAGLLIFAWRSGVIRLDCDPWQGLAGSLRGVARVGAPAAVSNAINPAGMAVVTGAVAMIGDAAVAGFGAASRVQTLLLVPMLALSSGIGPIVGQAWGAGMTDRATAALHLSFRVCLAYGFFLALVLTVLAEPIARLMTNGNTSTSYATTYLRVVGWSFFAYGILVVGNAAMNARDKALWSMGLSAAHVGLVFAPLVWIGVVLIGYPGIVTAAVIAGLIGGWGALVACQAVCLLDLDWSGVRGPAVTLSRRLPRFN